MLVLSRRIGESIRIANDIVVKVTEIRGNQVRLAFEAPHSCRIARGEVRQLAQTQFNKSFDKSLCGNGKLDVLLEAG